MRDDDEFFGYDRSPILSMKIPPHIELKLEDNQTNIYIGGVYVKTCMGMKIIIPIKNVSEYDYINSIDELSEHANKSNLDNGSFRITPKEEFRGHCSNIQAWVENNYDTCILHSNIAFPLLKRLTHIGDPLARNVFKEEIAERFSSGERIVILFLLEGNYLGYLDEFEQRVLLESVVINFVKFTVSEFNEFADLCEGIFQRVGENAQKAFLMNNISGISDFIAKQLVELKFDNNKIHILSDSLNRLISFLIRYEERFFDYGKANYKIKKHFSSDADAEIRNGTTLSIQYKNEDFYTETELLYNFQRYEVFLDLKVALFGDEIIMFSNINTNINANNINNIIVDVILNSKKAEEFFSENFSNIFDWIKYKEKAINQLTDLEQSDLDITDKVHYIYLILWNLLCRYPKQREKRFIKQANFFFEITEFYNAIDCDVAIEIQEEGHRRATQRHLHQGEFGQGQRIVLIVKNRDEQFYREYRDEELHDIMKSVFFRDENLTIYAAFWKRDQQIFEIDVKFDLKKNE